VSSPCLLYATFDGKVLVYFDVAVPPVPDYDFIRYLAPRGLHRALHRAAATPSPKSVSASSSSHLNLLSGAGDAEEAAAAADVGSSMLTGSRRTMVLRSLCKWSTPLGATGRALASPVKRSRDSAAAADNRASGASTTSQSSADTGSDAISSATRVNNAYSNYLRSDAVSLDTRLALGGEVDREEIVRTVKDLTQCDLSMLLAYREVLKHRLKVTLHSSLLSPLTVV